MCHIEGCIITFFLDHRLLVIIRICLISNSISLQLSENNQLRKVTATKRIEEDRRREKIVYSVIKMHKKTDNQLGTICNIEAGTKWFWFLCCVVPATAHVSCAVPPRLINKTSLKHTYLGASSTPTLFCSISNY